MKKDKHDLITLAKNHLRGEEIDTETYKELYEGLIQYEQFGYATEIILKRIEEIEKKGETTTPKLYHELARNVYKDTTLSGYFKFGKALNILKTHCKLDDTLDCETLGIAGAIYKYKWKFDHQFRNLLKSRAYYKKGYQLWKEDHSRLSSEYTAINYAYANELIVVKSLEQLSEIEGVTDEVIKKFTTSQNVRKEIINTYVNDDLSLITDGPDKWFNATIAEAYFGTRQYEKAIHFIKLYVADIEETWKIQTFAQQLYHIASFQETEKKFNQLPNDPFETKKIDTKKQKQCFLALEKNEKENLTPSEFESKKEGKLGIGLSGGGFRAALFHIGVLASLAEKDKLRDIEVMSCVSGGSIIGVYYYLKLKHLLETKVDDEITKLDYIEIVKEIEIEFQAAVEKNLRVQVFSNLFKNVKMYYTKKYSRSYRLGELYEEHFYLPLFNKYFDKNVKAIYMGDLIIKPKSASNFNIYNDNWKRKNKIPQLILNSTAVNTGHNWQFTATWMGEPPTYISDTVDVKPRLRRMYYQNAPEAYQKFRLGYAVAASSCVPVLFEPLLLSDLYEDIDLELIDGGVHDNQGIASILEQECSSIIISDGSAQMSNNYKNVANELSLFLRVDTILQERLREIQLLDLKSRKYSENINQLYIVHLKKGLGELPVSWINCTDVNRKILHDGKIEDPNVLLDYGLMKKIQQQLSEVRTDLDSFNELESFALMYSGYQQTNHEVDYAFSDTPEQWSFKKIEPSCTLPAEETQLINQLKISTYVPFKIVRLSKLLQYFAAALGIVLLILLINMFYKKWESPDPIFTITYQEVAVAAILIVLSIYYKFAKYINIESWIKKNIFYIIIIFLGFLLSNIYLLSFNKLYNKIGKMR
ncbi:patatin-like phospholipase [Flavobacterium sp. 9]|uniref:patatin-like phospholipase family protein n=1 Tax=Flavobacterium sp. 9 TaxID=2035198 RepID=UPI000C19D19C|nr:patatin-like phospholipase family protein [Flavobacterium sp. 9]PIF34360.1 patatin-like phospholipase [Flavobacterium sp. 9]